jgi:type II secretory ATPase GspE/PulE/Tfp pilus assembly ATPase PilB-like protein
MAERAYTTYQVADLLGATPSAVVEWMQKGWLPFHRMPQGSIRISEKQLVHFLRGQGIDIEKVMAKAVMRQQQHRQTRGDDNENQPIPLQIEGTRPLLPAAREPEDRWAADEDNARPGNDRAGLAASEAAAEPNANEPTAEGTIDAGPADKVATDQEPSQGQPSPAALQVLEAVLRDMLRRRGREVVLTRRDGRLGLAVRIDGALHHKHRFAQRLPAGLATELPELLLRLGRANEGTASTTFETDIDGRAHTFELSALVAGDDLQLRIAPADLPPSLDDLVPDEALVALVDRPGLYLLIAPPAQRPDILTLMTQRMENPVWLSESNAAALRAAIEMAAIEQRPIIVGELADPASARAALAAAADVPVLAAMPCTTSAAALNLMASLGVGSWHLAGRLRAVVAACLPRRLCDECKQPIELTDAIRQSLPRLAEHVFGPRSCGRCGQTGFIGRLAVASIAPVEGELARAIAAGDAASAALITRQCCVLDSGLEAVAKGLTSPEELLGALPD